MRGYDQWKTASPYDDFDDTICYNCQIPLDDASVKDHTDCHDDGFCTDKCEKDVNKKRYLPLYRSIIRLFSDLFDEDEFEFSNLKKAVYKGTSSGVWIKITGQDTIAVGCIVEGLDGDGIVADPLVWPFTKEDFWNTVEWANDEACAKWEEINGGR